MCEGPGSIDSVISWEVSGFDNSSCGFSLTLCVVILDCYLVFIPNRKQARKSPTLPETSPPLKLD